MVVDFHSSNYFGENIVICGTGQINHDELVEEADRHFGGLQKKAPKPLVGLNTPTFHASNLFIHDEDLPQSNVGVFYNGPSWASKDFYAFLLLQRIFGNYSIERSAEHVIDSKK
jgi:mitochondrial-processing peptidase subunit beta